MRFIEVLFHTLTAYQVNQHAQYNFAYPKRNRALIRIIETVLAMSFVKINAIKTSTVYMHSKVTIMFEYC